MQALARLADAGFDLVHAFDAGALARDPRFEVLAGPEHLGLLVGNTRALWPRFTDALRDPALARDPDPLDRYTEHTLERAFHGARIYFAHRTYAGAYVPLQHLAVATGFGALAPSRLVIHPVHGPWIALRAVIVTAGEPPPVAQPIAQMCRCDAPCQEALAAALAGPPSAGAWLAVREACSLRASRYSDDQIEFHYRRLRFPDADR